MLVVAMNTSERQSIRTLLLNNGFREQWLNEMNAGEFLYFKINFVYNNFTTIKHDDYESEFNYMVQRGSLEVLSASIFRKRFDSLLYSR